MKAHLVAVKNRRKGGKVHFFQFKKKSGATAFMKDMTKRGEVCAITTITGV